MIGADRDLRIARWLAILVPAALMAGALGSQHIGGLFPCEMCLWQRQPHYAAIVLAIGAFLPGVRPRVLVGLAAAAVATSGVIGVMHAGVEYGWWQGFTACTSTVTDGPGTALERIMRAPLVRCDQPQWTLAGISLAGYNAIVSLGTAAIIAGLLLGGRKRNKA